MAFAGLLPNYEYPKPAQPQPDPWKEEKWTPANYEFNYEVNNPSTGDIKAQEEKAVNGKVTGFYWLVEPDGLNKRIVEYTADDENGFIVSLTTSEKV